MRSDDGRAVWSKRLDAGGHSLPTPRRARAHAVLMAGKTCSRTNGDGDAAVERLEPRLQARPIRPTFRSGTRPGSPRPRGKAITLSAGTDLAENSSAHHPSDKAVACGPESSARRAPRPGTDVEPMPINDGIRRARTALVANDVVGAALASPTISGEPALSKAASGSRAALGATTSPAVAGAAGRP